MKNTSTLFRRRLHIGMLILLTGMIIIVDLMTLAFGFPAEIVQTPGIEEMKLPTGYREWKVISVAHEGGKLNDIRAILGNDLAFNASRDEIVPYPDGAMIVRLAWRYTPSEENNNVFGSKQSFVAGLATNVQLLVKDSRKFSATGGWGFAQFSKNNPTNEAVAKDCFACHTPVKHNDYVFTRYAP